MKQVTSAIFIEVPYLDLMPMIQILAAVPQHRATDTPCHPSYCTRDKEHLAPVQTVSDRMSD